jgi:hypothetical protein
MKFDKNHHIAFPTRAQKEYKLKEDEWLYKHELE